MKFRSRYTGEFALSRDSIRNTRQIKRGDTLTFSETTARTFGESLMRHVKAGVLVAIDDEARAFVKQMPVQAPLTGKPEEAEPAAEQAPAVVETVAEPIVEPAPEPAVEQAVEPTRRRKS